MKLDEIESVLEAYGLSPYQANAFLTVLELRDASVSEINEASNVPQPRIYDVLETLNEKGIIETYEKGSLRARITDPTTFIDSLEQLGEDLYDTADIIDDYYQKPPLEKHSFEIYDDFQQVLKHAVEDVRQSTDSINLALSASSFLQLHNPLKEAIENDIIINISIHITEGSKTGIDDLMPYLRDAASEVRYRETSAPFLALVDSHRSYFGVSRPQSGYGMFVQDQALSTMLYRYFQDTLWRRWEVIHGHGRRTDKFRREYASIRNCVRDLRSYPANRDSLEVTVDGYETDTGRERHIEGVVADFYPSVDDGISVTDADQINLAVETECKTYTVGGFGAIVEDLRATRIRVTRLEDPSA
ncbi:TrmB family transcriptional regulator sugar-binding domain-containing protein [Saliphagus infecundisoli]|uniref:TrmB family transcriptional regulator sugar-binding domain-containing protein n=1 Tax=Saliphagus infecundisoli TaxID=1849069 RepID=A0ABD5QCU7_9EURY|nr:TrmB family transcriptional regulator sugar-binding domain-containing protein [Saliphagus infecundisoli]